MFSTGENSILVGTGGQVKLEGESNWHTWKFRVTVLLRAAGVYDVVDGSSPRPVKDTGTGLQDWLTKDAKAQGIIVTRMSETIISQIINCQSAASIWSKLEAIFEQKGELSIHLVQQKFFALQFKEQEKMSEFLGRVEQILSTLKLLGAEVQESMAITKITTCLPERFQHFISAWESVPKEKRTLDELSTRLLVEEQRYKAKNEEQTSALSAVKTTRKCFSCGKTGHYKKDCKVKSGFSGNTSNKYCSHCKKTGHVLNNCWFKNKSNSNAFNVSVLSALNSDYISDEWVMDSGASEHMCKDIGLFSKYIELKSPKQILIGDGTTIKAQGIGEITLEAYNGKFWVNTTLSNVLFVPEIKFNLFSVSTATQKNYQVKMDNDLCIFSKPGNKYVGATAIRKNKLYVMQFRYIKSHVCVGYLNSELTEWHNKMGHQNMEQVKCMLKKCNIEFTIDNQESTCVSCLKGKFHKQPFPVSENRAKSPGQLIHMDLCGPMETTSLGGARYYLLIKDDYSRYRTVCFLKNKSETADKIKSFLMYVTKNLGFKIETIRSDNGTEFVNKCVKTLTDGMGIIHQTSVPYTPEQNGCAEREIRTVTEAARTMLLAKNMPKTLWAEAVNTAVYVLNRTGKSRVKNVTPYELWFNKGVYDVNQLKVFGSKVAVHIPRQKRNKWDSKSDMGYFVGYGKNTKGFRVYYPQKNDVLIKREVMFYKDDSDVCEKYPINEIQLEDDFPVQNMENSLNKEIVSENDEDFHSVHEDEDVMIHNQNNDNVFMDNVKEELPQRVVEEKCTEESIENEDIQEQEMPKSQEVSETMEQKIQKDLVSEEEGIGEGSRLRKVRKQPGWLQDYELNFLASDAETISYEQAIKGSEKEKWQEAINKELQTLRENNTWTEVNEVPKNTDIVSSKWVFRIKEKEDGGKLYKARLVARGFEQSNVDSEVYSPVARLPTFRVFMAVANKMSRFVQQADIVGAFLYGDIYETVYLKLPSGEFCKLNKSLYGLKKSPKYWNDKYNDFMQKQGFTRSKNDHCLYFRKTGTNIMYVLVYVDDILYFSSCDSEEKEFKAQISSNFKIHDLGKATTYLGINIIQENGKTTISQEKYMSKILDTYGMKDCKPIATPIDQNFNFELLEREKSENPEIESKCRQLIGSLMFAVCGTRPDLCVAVCFLSRFQHCASDLLYKCLKRILRYVRGTLQYSLVYLSKNVGIQGYVDSDWAGDKRDRKSTTGYFFKVFNCVVLWCSKKQSSVSLSSTESEYIALSMAITEACWLKNLLCDFNIVINEVIIHEDNQSVIKLALNNENNKRLKHLDIRYHFIIDKIKEKCISLQYVRTDDNLADLLTKPLGKTLFEKFVNLMFLK